jgi:hypothetical protein
MESKKEEKVECAENTPEANQLKVPNKLIKLINKIRIGCQKYVTSISIVVYTWSINISSTPKALNGTQ